MAAVVRRREQMAHALAALSVSVMVTGVCYVFMRSWEFGRLSSLGAASPEAERARITARPDVP